MASVVRKRKSKFWYACFSLPDGRRRQVTTRTTDKKKAQKIAWASEEAARMKGTVDQARKIIAKVVEEIQGDVISQESCGDYFAKWKLRRQREVSPGTMARFLDVEKSLKESVGTTWDLPLSDLTPSQLSDWRDTLAGRLAPQTVNVYLKMIRQALNDAWNDGKISSSPAEKLKMMKIPKGGSAKKVFTAEQYLALIKVADSEWEGVIHAGAFTGQRLSDIVSMKVADIEFDWWRFQSRKTGLNLAIPLAAPFLNWYRRWLPERKIASEYVFPELQVKMHEYKGGLSNQFYRLMVTAGIVPPRDNHAVKGVGRSGRRASSELSFHSFRHTCTTWLKASGESESVAMAFVGHESKAVNRSYTHLPESTLLEAMKKMEKFSA